MKSESIIKAEYILARVDLNLKRSEDYSKYHVEMYCNGREQGYCISSHDKQVSFSSARNSDSTVVYTREKGERHFSMQGNVPNDEQYRRRAYFNPDQIEAAVAFIVKYLTTME